LESAAVTVINNGEEDDDDDDDDKRWLVEADVVKTRRDGRRCQ